MHFDNTYPYRSENPIPQKHPCSILTVNLLRNALDTNDHSELHEVIESSLKGVTDREVKSEELVELKEIEMEMLLMKREYREMAEEINARNYTARISVLFNWLGLLFAVIGYIWYEKHNGPIDKFKLFEAELYLFLASASVFGLVWWLLDYTPLPDDEDKKIRERFEMSKKKLEPKVKLWRLLRKKKKLIKTFLSDFVPIRTRYEELWWQRFYLKCHNAVPVTLFYLMAYWRFVSDGLKNGNKDKEFQSIIIHFSCYMFTIPFYLWG